MARHWQLVSLVKTTIKVPFRYLCGVAAFGLSKAENKAVLQLLVLGLREVLSRSLQMLMSERLVLLETTIIKV
jgi:hypothetical protein